MSESSSDSDDSQKQNHELEIINLNPIKITLRPSKLSQAITMANMTLGELKTFTDVIPHYEGNIKLLNNFINTVDEVYAMTNTIGLSQLQKTYLFGIVKTKLINKAAELLSENNFKDWEELKLYLTTNFTDKLSAETILQDIMYCKFKINAETTLKFILEKFLHYKSKILLTAYSSDQKNAIITEVQKLIVRHFISLLPTSIRGSFVVKNPDTLEQCELLLRNEFNFVNLNPQQHSSPLVRNVINNKIQPQKSTADHFPSQPINFKQNPIRNNTPFAPRENIKNYVQTSQQFNPRPMSTQTRQTQPMSFQTIRQNYNIESDEQINYDEEEETDEYNNDFLDLGTVTYENTT